MPRSAQLQTRKSGRGTLQWTRALLVPDRVRLLATAGPDGARAARTLYRQRRGRAIAWAAGRGSSLALSHRVGRRCPPPVEDFEELCDILGIAPVGAAAMYSGMARAIICIVGRDATVVVKVAGRSDAGLSTEAALLGMLNGAAGPVMVPRLHWYGAWRESLLLATQAIPLSDRQRLVSVTEAAATATALCLGPGGLGPIVHGDLAPWNLLRAPAGLALFDWGEGRLAAEPLFDLTHFVVTGGALRHSPPEGALAKLTAPGSPGWLHLEALGVDPSTAPTLVRDYLRRAGGTGEGRRRYREALLRLLGNASSPRPVARVRAQTISPAPRARSSPRTPAG